MSDLPVCEDSLVAHGYPQEMRALIDWVGKDIEPTNAAMVSDAVLATTLGIKAIESIKTGQPQSLL